MARTIINLPLRNSVDESYNTAVNICRQTVLKKFPTTAKLYGKRYRTFDCYAIHKN